MIPGIHIVADLHGCETSPESTDATVLQAACLALVAKHGLTTVTQAFHQFVNEVDSTQPSGVTGCVVLAESHLAIHTWPEFGTVTLDVYVCNVSQDNSAKARALVEDVIRIFAPVDVRQQEVARDQVWLQETLNGHLGHGLRSSRLLMQTRSPYQRLELHENEHVGRVLRLDDVLQTSERDEFFYHENMIHHAAATHPKPRHALVVGGGDGGAIEELLKHPDIEYVALVELDQMVVDVAREHLGRIHQGAFDDPRLEIIIADGEQFIRQTRTSFDLIVLDLPDPGPGCEKLYELEFFEACRRRLNDRGLLTLHLGSTTADSQRLRDIHGAIAEVFEVVRPVRVNVPLYGGEWLLAVCSATEQSDPLTITPEVIDARLAERGINDLQYYSGDMHHAGMVLPNYLRKVLMCTRRDIEEAHV